MAYTSIAVKPKKEICLINRNTEVDIHVFYNEGSEFNVFRCRHVCGGNCKKGRMQELWETCRRITLETTES